MIKSITNPNKVFKEDPIYEIQTDIHSLDFQIRAADLIIEQGDKFYIESNMKNLSVYEEDGVLIIIERIIAIPSLKKDILKICIPSNKVFEKVDISTGAGKISADYMSANSVELKLGAGKTQFEHLNAGSDIDIKGGAGDVIINDGSLNNLSTAMGAGKLSLTAALFGENDLKLGVGKTALTVIGSKNDYNLNIMSGIGKISINETNDVEMGNREKGHGSIKINGGVGEAKIVFQG